MRIDPPLTLPAAVGAAARALSGAGVRTAEELRRAVGEGGRDTAARAAAAAMCRGFAAWGGQASPCGASGAAASALEDKRRTAVEAESLPTATTGEDGRGAARCGSLRLEEQVLGILSDLLLSQQGRVRTAGAPAGDRETRAAESA